MDNFLKLKIKSEYEQGKSSTIIAKELNLSKPTILIVLHEYGIVRKKERCSKLKYNFDGEKFYVERKCPKCDNILRTTAKQKVICCRNYYNAINKKSICKNCLSEASKGKNNNFYGKKHKKETIIKISENRKGKSIGEKNSMANPIWRKKARTNLKKRWDSGELESTRKHMSETLKKTIREGKIKSNIFSKKELEILEILTTMGYDTIHSYKVDTKICDIFIPSLNLIIEYFGDYWHCNPNKYDYNYFNVKKKKFAWELWDYDEKKLDLIMKLGYNLEVIWESELKDDNKLIEKIISKYDKTTIPTP